MGTQSRLTAGSVVAVEIQSLSVSKASGNTQRLIAEYFIYGIVTYTDIGVYDIKSETFW